MSGFDDLEDIELGEIVPETTAAISTGLVDTPPARVSLHRQSMGTFKLGGPKFEIDKFDGRTDYVLWERQMKNVLRAMGLGRILKPMPSGMDQDEWESIQEQSVSLVSLYLKPSVFKQVAEQTDVTKMFDTLRSKYYQDDMTNRLYMILMLGTFKWDGSGKIQDHIEAFNDMVVDLENLGEILEEERKAITLLGSLPQSYWSLSRTLLHRDKKTITYNEVISALKTDEMQQKLTSSGASTSNAAALNVNNGGGGGGNRGRSQTRDTKSRGKSRSKSRGKSGKNKDACWKCGKLGHMKKDCWSKSKPETSANVAVSADGGEDLLDDEFVL